MITADDVRELMKAADLNQAGLAKRLGVSQPTVSRWLKGATPDPAQEAAIRALMLEMLHGTSELAPGSRSGVPLVPPWVENFDAPAIDKGQFPRDVPVIGIAACGDDASFTLNGQTGDFVRRPPGLEGKRNVYALNVCGDSMYPVYRHNALVYVDPTKTPGVTEDAVIELHPEDPRSGEPGKGFLKRVKKIAAGKIICEQFNPPEEVIFERDEVKNFHRVIPWEEVLGY